MQKINRRGFLSLLTGCAAASLVDRPDGILPFVSAQPSLPAHRFGVRGPHFTLNDTETFLFGISYYGALGATREVIQADLDRMKSLGINWIRVWATWGAFDINLTVVNPNGSPRQPYLSYLQWLVAECDRRGLVVDVTLSRGNGVTGKARLQELTPHQATVETIIAALKDRGNWYLDLGNERNIRDQRYTPMADLVALRIRARELSPALLVTASHAGDIDEKELRRYIEEVKVDFLSPHRPRDARSPSQTPNKTRWYLDQMKTLGRVVPVHYQEPFRRDFSVDWNPVAADFVADAKAALESGAAGWCLHNGDNRAAPDGRPRRSFDLRDGSLFSQFDAEERKVLDQLVIVFKGTP